MSGRNILALVIAIVVGIVVLRILFGLLSLAFTLIGWLVYIAIGGVVVYLLYRGFNNMLSSGRRLT